MGLDKSCLRFLAREHRRQPFTDPVLLLGRPNVFATIEDAIQLLDSEQIEPAPLIQRVDTRGDVSGWRHSETALSMRDSAFFRLMGLHETLSLDYSAYEGADIIADLNLPVPEDLKNRFGLIADPGTMEHVFDIKQGLMNVASMLKVGGRVAHFSPVNSYVNHGFYQFSPSLFYDFYAANGFTNLRADLVVTMKNNKDVDPVGYYEYQHHPHRQLNSPYLLEIRFSAEKTASSTADKNPIQTTYAMLYDAWQEEQQTS